VAFHRANIRAKLGLKKKRPGNLVSYLRSLSMKESAGAPKPASKKQ
jgi:hypothetical protein